MMNVHVGRQPIFDRSLGVLGYELLFRASADAASSSMNGDLATTQVIINTFTEFGLERLVGSRTAFVNVTRTFVTGELPMPLPPRAVVLELLETIPADPEVMSGVRRLREQGFVLALDDYTGEQERAALLPYCSYIKIDIDALPPQELAALVEKCRTYDAKLVAERVDSAEDMERCLDLRFDYFQGYHLVRPDVVTGKAISPSQLACLELLAKLSEPDVSIRQIEDILRTDVALNYRLLRAVNAAHSGSVRRISSIREALVLIGLQQLRSWLLLLTLSDAGRINEEMLSAALTRARTCELMAASLVDVRTDSAFVTGLLSCLDAVLGMEMDQVVERLPLGGEIQSALLRREGPLGALLTAVVAYENGQDPPDGNLDAFELSRSYLAAVGWSLQVCESALAPS